MRRGTHFTDHRHLKEPYMSRPARVWTLRKVSTRISLSMPLDLYLYPLETECVGPDQSAPTAQADLGRYITQRHNIGFLTGDLNYVHLATSQNVKLFLFGFSPTPLYSMLTSQEYMSQDLVSTDGAQMMSYCA